MISAVLDTNDLADISRFIARNGSASHGFLI
jgi:hypothetical protein